MFPTVKVEINDIRLREKCNNLAARLERGMPDTMKDIGLLLTARNREAFERGQRGGMNKPLSKKTVKRRRQHARKTGKRLVAGEDTPLRAFGDRLYKAATAGEGDAHGAIFEVTGSSVTVGIDPRQIIFARMATGLHPKAKARGVPLRLPTVLEEADKPEIRRIGQAGLSRLLEKSHRG